MEIRQGQDPDKHVIFVSGALSYRNVGRLFKTLKQAVAATPGKIQVDLAEVTAMDSAAVACMVEANRLAKAKGAVLELRGVHAQLERTFSILPWKEVPPNPPSPKSGWLERIGGAGYDAFGLLLNVLILVSDIFYWAVVAPFRRKLPNFAAVMEQGIYMGADAVAIVGLTSFLVGMTLALLSSYQLRQFGADIFVANLVGVAMAREMGPLIAAIIVAGRSGAAIAAEIATMVVTEEVDALKTMGVNPMRFVVIPKVWAITITQPLLTVMSDLLGIFGGFMVGVLILDLSPMTFINQLLKTLFVFDIVTGLIKSIAFAWIIVIVGTYKGFHVEGGAKGVGLATTSSVVICLFTIIITDAFFSLLFTFTE